MGSGIKGAWLARESRHVWRVNSTQSFYAWDVSTLDPKILKKIVEVQDTLDEIQKYLEAVHAAAQTRNPAFMETVEVPECLQETARSEEPRKKRATAARSSKKSPSKQKKKASSSSTSQKKAE